ncbi:MAG: ABC transporter ATP-binding protein [Candidatus Nanoarchaeia archaeon]|nr:ABC transporter ATP-binding protein [Candidatus Nanoarchaeia archaeon]
MLLEIKKLEKSFDGIKAVTGCDFAVKENEIAALIGPNGAGKTTVFNLITGLVKPDNGEILFKGELLNGLEPHEISSLGIARTFQLIRLFPELSVMENLLLAKQKQGERLIKNFTKPNFIKKEELSNIDRCLEFLKLVGLEEKRNEFAKNLSYGQQKLLEIARAMSTEADLILLDEPVAGVNPVMRDKIKRIIFDLKKQGKTILFIEHDMKFLMDISDKIIVMDHGEEIAIGTPQEIQNNKQVAEAYLGRKK